MVIFPSEGRLEIFGITRSHHLTFQGVDRLKEEILGLLESVVFSVDASKGKERPRFFDGLRPMLGTQRRLPDLQNSVVELLRTQQVTLCVEYLGEIVHCPQRGRMLGPQQLTTTRQHLLLQLTRSRQICLSKESR